MACQSASTVRAAVERNNRLSLLNSSSMGFRSGLYDGKNHKLAPRASNAGNLVTVEIVRHHDVARQQGRRQELFDPGQKGSAVDGAVQHQRCDQPIVPQAAEKRRGLPMAVRHRADQPFAAWCATVRVMLVVAQVSSRNTSLRLSSFGMRAIHAARASTISARSCSAARRRFFERQAEFGQGLPHHRMAHRNAVRGFYPGSQLGNRRVLLLGQPLAQRAIERRQAWRHMIVLWSGRRRAGLAKSPANL
jgi:hypothetical protein